MIYVLIGYMELFIHRPFEIWPVLATVRLERLYVAYAGLRWALYPQKGWIRNPLTPAFIAFLLATVASWLASPYPEEGTSTIEEYLKYFVFYFFVMASIRDERQFKLLLLGFVGVLGVYTAHSYREFLCGRYEYRQGIPRMIGVDLSFNDPNTFAGTLMFAFPLSFPFWAEAAKVAGKRRRRLAYAALLGYTGLTLMCVNLTGSRRGFLGLLFLGIITGLLRSRHKFLMLIVLPVAGLGLWSILPAHLQMRYYTLIAPDSAPGAESARGRFQALDDGIELWGRSPAFGFGPMAFGKAVGHGFHAHNTYAQLFGEVGTAGMVTFAVVLLCYASNAYRIWSIARTAPTLKAGFSNKVSRSITLCILLMLFMGFGGHLLFRYNWLWFGAFQAVALHCIRQRAAERSDPGLGSDVDAGASAEDGTASGYILAEPLSSSDHERSSRH